MELRNVYGTVIFTLESAKSILELVIAAKNALPNLRYADLRGANLYGANLRRADLRRADLRGADLRGADLYGANLRRADLRGANLRRADLRGADLRDANLYGADLRDANLRSAGLRGADLHSANLYGANLRSANLRDADDFESSIKTFRSISSNGYPYQVLAVLFKNGERWIRMGCLWKSLEDWEKLDIRESNTSEFPNNGSLRSEERATIFEFAKMTVKLLK